MKYRINTFAKIHRVTRRCVELWIKKGIIKSEVDEFKHRWIIVDDEEKLTKEMNVIIYLRVNSKSDQVLFDDQEKRLTEYCISKGYKISKVVREIAPVVSQESPKLLDLLLDKTVDIIVTDIPGNISIFGSTMIEKLLDQQGRKLEIVNQSSLFSVDERKKSIESLLSWGCEELYGKRKAKEVMKDILAVLDKHKP